MELTHFNDEGRARMVDVTEKPQTIRIARAAATVNMCAETMQMLRSGGMKKGDVLAVAQVAGIMAAWTFILRWRRRRCTFFPRFAARVKQAWKWRR